MIQRYTYLDWLRVLATIAVVTIHVAAGLVAVNLLEVPLSNWMSANLYDSLMRASVPLFVMISGALLLGDKREMTYKDFFMKRAAKVFIPLLGWSAIYYAYKVYNGTYIFSIKEPIRLFMTQGISVHLWFLYMILGMYLITPLVKILVQNAKQRDLQYFLLLWFYASIGVKFMKYIIGFGFNPELYFVTNYVGYYILGYYLANFEISPKWRKLIYAGGIVGVLATMYFTYSYTLAQDGVLSEIWYDYHSPNVAIVAIAAFLFAKNVMKKEVPRPLNIINNTSFGIYLIHMLVLNVFADEIFYVIKDSVHPILSIPICVLINLIISSIVILIMKKIPLVKKLVP